MAVAVCTDEHSPLNSGREDDLQRGRSSSLNRSEVGAHRNKLW